MVDKIILSNVTTFQNDTTAVNTINNNNSILITALDNTLSRDGTSPNQMGSNLDMNSFNIINLPPPATVNSPARLVDVVSNPTVTVPPVGTSGAVVGLLNTNNTYSGTSTFTNTVTLPSNSIPNSELAQMAGNTVKGNSTGITANASDLTVTNFLTFLQSQNNSASNLAWFASNDVSTSGLFATPLIQAIAGGANQNCIIGQAIQNQASAGFPAGITGYGKLTNSGNQVFGIYGRADTTVAGSCAHEFDINNNSANDAPTTIPIANSFGTGNAWPVGLFIAAGGGKRSYAGIYMTGVPGNVNQVQYGIYQDKAFPNIAGIYLDADATHSPVNSLVVKNTGLSSNIPVIVQTLGTLNSTQPVIQLQNLSAGSIWEVHQDGSVVGTNNVTATTISTSVPVTLTGTSGTITGTQSSTIFNGSGTFTVTLPSASTSTGKWLYLKNIAAQAVNSASANVVPITGGAAGGAIFAATAGKFVNLQSDGTNWQIMALN